MPGTDHSEDKEKPREQLNEPALAPATIPSTRIHVHDGLDTSNLRMLLDLAI